MPIIMEQSLRWLFGCMCESGSSRISSFGRKRATYAKSWDACKTPVPAAPGEPITVTAAALALFR